MTKNERIAALESRMTAVEQHCGIAPPADPAPVALTAEDAKWLIEPDALHISHYYGADPAEAVFARVEQGRLYFMALRKGVYGEDSLAFPSPRITIPPATAAAIAQRKASATLAVGDTVEVTGLAGSEGKGCRMLPVGSIHKVEAGHYLPGCFVVGGYLYHAASLRRVQPAPDVQPCAKCGGIGTVPEDMSRLGGFNSKDCPDCTPAEQPAPLKGEKYP